MKKAFTFVLALAMCLTLFTACGDKKNAEELAEEIQNAATSSTLDTGAMVTDENGNPVDSTVMDALATLDASTASTLGKE